MTRDEFCAELAAREPTVELSVEIWVEYDRRRHERAREREKKHKAAFYLPEIVEIEAEARRRGCSVSAVVQEAWTRAREQIMKYPAPR